MGKGKKSSKNTEVVISRNNTITAIVVTLIDNCGRAAPWICLCIAFIFGTQNIAGKVTVLQVFSFMRTEISVTMAWSFAAAGIAYGIIQRKHRIRVEKHFGKTYTQVIEYEKSWKGTITDGAAVNEVLVNSKQDSHDNVEISNNV